MNYVEDNAGFLACKEFISDNYLHCIWFWIKNAQSSLWRSHFIGNDPFSIKNKITSDKYFLEVLIKFCLLKTLWDIHDLSLQNWLFSMSGFLLKWLADFLLQNKCKFWKLNAFQSIWKCRYLSYYQIKV